jgi:RES domain-containing protein
VHLDKDMAPPSFVAIPADVPEDASITRLRAVDLVAGWRTTPPPESLAEIGARWLEAKHTLVLAVPSAIIPSDLNYLLNPLHPQFRRVRIGRPEPFTFDPRLRKP